MLPFWLEVRTGHKSMADGAKQNDEKIRARKRVEGREGGRGLGVGCQMMQPR